MKKNAVLIAAIAVLMLAGAARVFSRHGPAGWGPPSGPPPLAKGGAPLRGPAGNVQIIEDSREGTIILRSDRWKGWCIRSGVVCVVNLGLLALLWFIPKKTEPDIILAYIVSGASFVLAIWVCLSGMLLARWKILPSAAAFIAGGGLIWACCKMLKMLKSLDAAFSSRQMKALENLEKVPKEDNRLAAVSGAYGDWPDTDFWKDESFTNLERKPPAGA